MAVRSSLAQGQDVTEWFFDDFYEGEIIRTMSRTITEADLHAFVGLGGFFEEMFISAPAARARFDSDRRVVPGMLTLVVVEGLYVLTGRMQHGLAFLGLTDLNIPRPCACGDTIRAEVKVEGVRVSGTPGRGIVSTSHRVLNGLDQEIMTYRTARLIGARVVPTP